MNSLSLAILFVFNVLLFSEVYQSKEHTLISNRILRLSARRKRSLLLPNYGTVKITTGFSKGLVGNIPKGLSLSYEMCSYFAGPTMIRDLLNEIRRPNPKEQGIDKANKMKNLKLWHENNQQRYPDALKTINSSHKSKNKQRLFERSSLTNEYEMFNIQSKSPLKEALDYLLGSDARCGILRLICKSEGLLLPRGYSMIQDIIRIVALALEKDFFSRRENSDFCEATLYPNCDVENERENSFDFLYWLFDPRKLFKN